MTTNTTLRQIQEEMQQEAKIDKVIDRKSKRILKTPKYKHYHIINERQNADALINQYVQNVIN